MSDPCGLLQTMRDKTRVLIHEFSQTQLGLVTRAQAIEAGLSASSIERRIASGELEKVRRSVYRVRGGPASTPQQRVLAVCLALGRDTVASHRTAAWLWQLDGFLSEPHTLEVTTAHGASVEIKGMTVHQRRHGLPEGYVCAQGVPATTLERTLLDLAPVVTDAQLERALDSAGRKKFGFVQEVAELLGMLKPKGREGIERLNALVELRRGDGPTDSGLETDVLRMVRTAGIETPFLQYPIFKSPERPLCHADFAWPRLMIALFADSNYHLGMRARLDAVQRLELTKMGWRPLVVYKKLLEDRKWIASFAELFHPKFPAQP